jgi:hypothetical protein
MPDRKYKIVAREMADKTWKWECTCGQKDFSYPSRYEAVKAGTEHIVLTHRDA